MQESTWVDKLSTTISRFSPKQDVAKFRNDYSEAMRAIDSQGKGAQLRETLLDIRKTIEDWVTAKDKCPCCTVREWTRIYESMGNLVPPRLLIAILKKLPIMKPGDADWQPFFFQCKNKSVLAALVDRRLASHNDLGRWTAARLRDAYQLPVLDLAVEQNAITDWLELFDACVKWGERPSQLTSREQMIVQCFTRDPAVRLESEFLLFLIENREARNPIYTILAVDLASGVKFAKCVASAVVPKQKGDVNAADLCKGFIAACREQFRDTNRALPNSAVILASLRLHLETAQDESELRTQCIALLRDAETDLTTTMLQRIEEDPTTAFGACLALLHGIEIHGATHRYLQSLRHFSDDATAPAERSSQLDQHLGKREVLEKVLKAVDEADDYQTLKDHLETAFFNLGVRNHGTIGEQTSFDPRRHRSTEPGVSRGDKVEVVREGRCLGEGDEMIVLSKALVSESD